MEIVEYLDAAGTNPFRDWFDGLDVQAAARVARVLNRMGEGNLADSKPVGVGVIENRIHFGPGYRLYFGRDGDTLIILLAGGTQTTSADRHWCCAGSLGRIQATEEGARTRWQ